LLGNITDSSVQTSATTKVAANWIQQDPLAASQWINTLPDGTARDGAVQQLIKIEGNNDPQTAFAWASSVSDDADRTSALRGITQVWAKQDPASATAAIQSAKISDQLRTELLQSVQNTASQ